MQLLATDDSDSVVAADACNTAIVLINNRYVKGSEHRYSGGVL